jgi:transposase-like protein
MGIVEDEQDAAREQLQTTVKRRIEARERAANADAEVKEAAIRAASAKIPVSWIAETIGVTRETIYKWIGRPVR